MTKHGPSYLILIGLTLSSIAAAAQSAGHLVTGPLNLTEALRIATDNYQLIKAKSKESQAAADAVKVVQKDAWPDLTLEVENAYGTLDGLNGVTSGQTGITTLTAGPVAQKQNWNAAFGALYVSDLNFNLYSFGVQRAHVAAARGQNSEAQADLAQTIFQQQVNTSLAYLDLLAAQQIRLSMEYNLQRISKLQEVILLRTLNGLNAGVDSSIANAEVSRARLSLITAQNMEQQKANHLSVEMGISPQSFQLDTFFLKHLPDPHADIKPPVLANHPTLQFLQSKVKTSDLLATYISRSGLPHVTLFAVAQERGSGFGTGYATNEADYTHDYFHGVSPIRFNYLAGIGLSWAITGFAKTRSRVAERKDLSEALNNEYELETNQLINQIVLADQQIQNALLTYREAPIQLRAASDAYDQKKALYENGLTNIVDVTQTLYLVNRAEIDKDVSVIAVWQAFLFKAATQGTLTWFLQQL
jgi:outer membrane protein TolC